MSGFAGANSVQRCVIDEILHEGKVLAQGRTVDLCAGADAQDIGAAFAAITGSAAEKLSA